ncbi:MAG: tetratricopeptide repeat protein, partial [Acidobacteriota bacterium]|nr:tetratricopeptide repeat protein [Acidobacteriota bacterium]
MIVEHRGIDIVARISGPDAKVISDVDAEMRLGGQENFELVADAAGDYRIDIEPKYKLLPAGHYQILLVELRTAGEKDTSLQEARKIHAESARLYNAGKYDEAQPLVQRALEIRVKELGEEHPDTVAALNHLARIYEKSGSYIKAEQTNRRTLLIAERTLGPEHPDVALYLHNLALTY